MKIKLTCIPIDNSYAVKISQPITQNNVSLLG